MGPLLFGKVVRRAYVMYSSTALCRSSERQIFPYAPPLQVPLEKAQQKVEEAAEKERRLRERAEKDKVGGVLGGCSPGGCVLMKPAACSRGGCRVPQWQVVRVPAGPADRRCVPSCLPRMAGGCAA